MWVIKVLTGPQSGTVFPLKMGKNKIGRGTACDVKIMSQGVSKEHAEIFITEDKVIISDLDSSNGTFVNGVRIQHQRLNPGDKIAMHDVIVDFAKTTVAQAFAAPYAGGGYQGNLAYQGYAPPPAPNTPPPEGAAQSGQGSPLKIQSLLELWEQFVLYFEEVAMPGIYQLARKFDFRMVIAAFLGAYVFMVTSVSTIPMASLIKTSIQEESHRRALTIARNLANINRGYLVERLEVNVTTQPAEREEGVKAAFIISGKDGTVIAPPTGRNSSFADKPFVNRVRYKETEIVEDVDSTTIGASVPIRYYNSEKGDQSILAYAVILYDIDSIALNRGKTFILFVETLSIALVFALLLYVLLMRVVERPVIELNAQLDDALREGGNQIETTFEYRKLRDLASNISSALARLGQNNQQALGVAANRDLEAEHLVMMTEAPALAISALDEIVLFSNPALEQLLGGTIALSRRSIAEIPDRALQENLRDLISQLRGRPEQIASGTIPFSGAVYELQARAVMGHTDPVYYYICLRPEGGRG